MHDDVQEERISCSCGDEGEENGVDALIASSLRLIERAHAATTKMHHEADAQEQETNTTEDPLVVSIERIGERPGEAHSTEAQKDKDHRTEAAEGSGDDRCQ